MLRTVVRISVFVHTRKKDRESNTSFLHANHALIKTIRQDNSVPKLKMCGPNGNPILEMLHNVALSELFEEVM
jgi:hypothetical protein